jgi:SAM-dependent methyltransferase
LEVTFLFAPQVGNFSLSRFRKNTNKASMTYAVANPISAPVEARVCHLCGSTELETVAEHDGKRLAKCLDCGVHFVQPQPSPGALTAHFEAGGVVGADELEAKFETNRQRVMSRVVNYIQTAKDGGTILDVGCATGLFLTAFAKNPRWQAWGIELSPWAAQHARRNGVLVHIGDTQSARFGVHSFDVITVLDTFYYFSHPASELAEFRRILKGDGLLVLELPWANTRIWRRKLGSKLPNGSHTPLLQSSDHLYYYTPHSVSLLLRKCGFAVGTIRPLPANRQERLVRDCLCRTYSFFSQLLWKLSASTIFLGPRFIVVARKDSAWGGNPELLRPE